MVALVTVACGGGEREAAPDPDAAGEPRWAPGEEWRIASEPRLTIGAVDGPEAIGRVGRSPTGAKTVALLPDGALVLVDALANEIRIYDGAGRRVATAGGTGDGPGEFQGLHGVAPFGGDSLMVWGNQAFTLRRLAVFTRDGRFVRTVTVPRTLVRSVTGVLADGRLVLEQWEDDGWTPPESGVFRRPQQYVVMSSSGEVVGSLGPLPGEEQVMIGRGGWMVIFGRRTLIAVGADVVYQADDHEFDIAAHDPATGVPARRLGRPVIAPPVTEEEVAGWREMQADANRRSLSLLRPGRRAVIEAQLPDPSEIPASETHAVMTRILEDAVGNVWVAHRRTRDDPTATWSVFDPSGEWLGEVDIPGELWVEDIGADRVAAVAYDDLDVGYVRVYDLVKPSR